MLLATFAERPGLADRTAEMAFPESGSYVVDGALVPVTISSEADRGEYFEPNVWMGHRVQ